MMEDGLSYKETGFNSRLSFNKNWREYEEGFGNLYKDFWAGLKLMHIYIYFNTEWPMGDESGLSKE